jgi:hypothetical protein
MTMVRSAEASAREAKIAELKHLITSQHYESLEKLEEAVEAFLWGEEEAESAKVQQVSISPASSVSPGIAAVSQGIAAGAAYGPSNPR